MLIKRKPELTYADVTPRGFYMGRRNFLLGALATYGAVAAYRRLPNWFGGHPTGTLPVPLQGVRKWPGSTTEEETPLEKTTHYNNFYEFGSDKSDPARNAGNFVTRPWTVSVEGEVAKPRKFTIDEIMHLAPLEERIYRHRCVEAWSIVVPWIGYSFSSLAKLVEPTSKARFVAFESYYNPAVMPWAAGTGIQFPYIEGLRMDEAMHPLALLCVGMYGQTLFNQDGAPVRMILPWKYGYKSIKSIVKIRFVKNEPSTTWNNYAPYEYGFYSNVNPDVDTVPWNQNMERHIGPGLGLFNREIPTRMFNGYGDQVASLYAGMDLRKYH
jgi:methionine sulfoxide reductase catalytic subunit